MENLELQSEVVAKTNEISVKKMDSKEIKKERERKRESKKGSPRSTRWCFTYHDSSNVNHLNMGQIHELLGARYTIGQRELCPTSGGLHLQFFCIFDKQVRWTHFSSLPGVHFEICVADDQTNIGYCSKVFDKKTGIHVQVEGPWEFGDKPLKRNSKKDWDIIRELAKKGQFDDIPADVYIKHYHNIKAIAKDNLVSKDSPGLRGVWIYGPSGHGKSHLAREMFRDHYPKLANKWWDGYQNQDSVILDDLGLDHDKLRQQLKLWGDRYFCVLESKGSALGSSSLENFIVTSQYSIEQIFKGDQETIDALTRRYHVIHLPYPMYAESDFKIVGYTKWGKPIKELIRPKYRFWAGKVEPIDYDPPMIVSPLANEVNDLQLVDQDVGLGMNVDDFFANYHNSTSLSSDEVNDTTNDSEMRLGFFDGF